jgi:hypothetical protein
VAGTSHGEVPVKGFPHRVQLEKVSGHVFHFVSFLAVSQLAVEMFGSIWPLARLLIAASDVYGRHR